MFQPYFNIYGMIRSGDCAIQPQCCETAKYGTEYIRGVKQTTDYEVRCDHARQSRWSATIKGGSPVTRQPIQLGIAQHQTRST